MYFLIAFIAQLKQFPIIEPTGYKGSEMRLYPQVYIIILRILLDFQMMPWEDLPAIISIHARRFEAEDQILAIWFLVINEVVYLEFLTYLVDDGLEGWAELPVDVVVVDVQEDNSLLSSLLIPALQSDE
jgi:hypothetical protein